MPVVSVRNVKLMDMQGVAWWPPPQASRRFLLKPSVDAFWNHPGGDQVEPPPFGSIELTWPGRANRSSLLRRTEIPLERSRCGFAAADYTRLLLTIAAQNCSSAGAPKRCSSDLATDATTKRSPFIHAAVPVDADRMPLSSCPLPSLLRRRSVMFLKACRLVLQ